MELLFDFDVRPNMKYHLHIVTAVSILIAPACTQAGAEMDGSIAPVSQPATEEPTSSDKMVGENLPTNIALLFDTADQIAIGEVAAVDNRQPSVDGNLTTVQFRTEQILKGPEVDYLSLRFAGGINNDGSVADIAGPIQTIQSRSPSFRPGDRLLIFTSHEAYREGSLARGGTPAAGQTQALELFRIAHGIAYSIADPALSFEVENLKTGD